MRHPCLILIVLALAFCPSANSQTNPEKRTATATISGKVTMKGKPARGIVVGVRLNQDNSPARTFQARTDDDGIYHITGVPGGSVTIAPVAPAFVISNTNEPWGRGLIVTEGDTIDGVDFDLLRGGVITGKVTDADGSPIIAQRISLMRVDAARFGSPSSLSEMFETDDRGIYRVFGLAPGRYKVSVSDQRLDSATVRGRSVPDTYHPSTTDSTKAAIIEVGEGTEATQVDITIARAIEGFAVTGHVIDRDTNGPVVNAVISLMRITVIDANSTSGSGGPTDVRTDAAGAFRLDKVPPGKYDISAEPPLNTSLIVEPINFDVVDADVSGLVIKTSAGASVSGTVLLEGSAPEIAGRRPQFWVYAHFRNDARGFSSTHPAEMKPDGTFKAGGLTPGIVSFSGGTFGPTGDAKKLTVARIERDGVAQPNAITIQGTEQIRGIRLVLSDSSGLIRGVVKVLNGTLSPTAHMVANLKRSNDPNEFGAAVDARGRFLIENVGPGTYELTIQYFDNPPRRLVETKQSVTVTAGETTDIVITLDLGDTTKP